MIQKKNIKINEKLYNFINNKVLKDININEDTFWNGFSDIVDVYYPKNVNLLKKRKDLQNKINNWHKENKSRDIDLKEYKKFLKKINYIVEEGPDFKITTSNIDEEISTICGPQLVVPITNARFAINAVNARWGSLYDALYGTDVLGKGPQGSNYDPERGDKVVKFAKSHLDKFAPLQNAEWNEINKIELKNNKIILGTLKEDDVNFLNKNQLLGWKTSINGKLAELILLKNNLHCRILINENDVIGKNDIANISDILVESAISTILDCEDSVATVDADDKVVAYQNWLGLVKGEIEAEFVKNKKTVKRVLNKDITYTTVDQKNQILKGRSLMLIRNVGHLMTTPAILTKNNNEIGEGIMDAIITTLIATHDFTKVENKNYNYNSIYIVKPKMHGPEEVEFTDQLFLHIEKLLGLPKNTIKIGIMDEERRTSINLKECIRAAQSRVAFINTGFLDRTGDEIHTAMQAGSFLKKADMKNAPWISSYEKRNVSIGLECGLKGKAQIGKGMWAMPDLMSEMMKQKISHPQSGANCAWVPSPTAATLHALHYHEVNVKEVQEDLLSSSSAGTLDDLLTLPLLKGVNLSENEITHEVENNAQGILGYVVRWIDQGIGCSKVPDINNIGLMEDRATCRISSQALTNWIEHGIVSKDQVLKAFNKMAKVVDEQNANDKKYIPMSNNEKSIAFTAAKELVFEGINQPSGYTEPILHKRRLEFKLRNN
ncbi:malate synthase G [Pelagibacterales bacterium SAG-MED31]|nr:malate synthase G [Pelagibacterales bacterium SAG-MED31]